MKTKQNLKDVFNGVGTILYQSEALDIVMADAMFNAAQTSYAVGDIVGYGGDVFTCKTAIAAAGAWDATKWDKQNTSLTVVPEYELPVEIGTLESTQGDPTINHYQIIGMEGDWTSSAKTGETTIKLDIPTNHTDVLKLCWGDTAVASASVSMNGASYTGSALKLNKHKITGSFVLINEEQTEILILNNVALWATPVYDNVDTKPFRVRLTGTIETGSGASMLFLHKAV